MAFVQGRHAPRRGRPRAPRNPFGSPAAPSGGENPTGGPPGLQAPTVGPPQTIDPASGPATDPTPGQPGGFGGTAGPLFGGAAGTGGFVGIQPGQPGAGSGGFPHATGLNFAQNTNPGAGVSGPNPFAGGGLRRQQFDNFSGQPSGGLQRRQAGGSLGALRQQVFGNPFGG